MARRRWNLGRGAIASSWCVAVLVACASPAGDRSTAPPPEPSATTTPAVGPTDPSPTSHPPTPDAPLPTPDAPLPTRPPAASSSSSDTSTPVVSITTETSTAVTTSTSVAPPAPLPVDRPIRVLVVGDSVAASLAADGDRERYVLSSGDTVDVRNVGSVACPIIFDGGWWFTNGSTLPDNPVCDRTDRYDDELAAFAPDLVLAIFGWPGAGGGQRFSDGTISTPCQPRFDAAWEAGYRDLVERLAPRATVVVSTVAPIAMDARREETQCLNRIVRRIPAKVLDLQDWLCPELDCAHRAELRTDGVHFADDADLRRLAMEGILAEVLPLVAS